MILEMCGSRMLAPYIGTSIVVWTSLIGVILGSLSIGYYLGGRVADKKDASSTLSRVLFLSAVFLLILYFLRASFLTLLSYVPLSIELRALVYPLVLFSIPSVLLGMVSPIAVRLRMQALSSAGGVIGNLYAVSTIGSIVGTFLAGFILIAHFSISQIIIGMAIALFLLSSVVGSASNKIKFIVIIMLVLVSIVSYKVIKPPKNVWETQYSHTEVLTVGDMKVLKIDNKWHSAMFLNRADLAFGYTKYYLLGKGLNPGAQKFLMIGGGGFTVASNFIKRYPDIKVDVVEIDPLLSEIAQKEFGLEKNARLTIFNEDGRTFINRQEGVGRYDVLLMDAFSSFSIPFQLTTIESVTKMKSLLTPQGIIITNLFSAVKGERAEFLFAEVATYKKVFPYVRVFRVNKKYSLEDGQNIILLASRSPIPSFDYSSLGLNFPYQENIAEGRGLTDDFAPVDQYIMKMEY